MSDTIPAYPDAPVKNSFELGMEFQDFICAKMFEKHIFIQNNNSKKKQFLEGENRQGFEIKLDSRCTDTGRLSIEIAERTSEHVNGFTASGIMRRDNTIFYIQGNYEAFWVFAKSFLVNYLSQNSPSQHQKRTIITYYLPIPLANSWAAARWTKKDGWITCP